MYGVTLSRRGWIKGLRRYRGFVREGSVGDQIRGHGGHSHSHARDAMENQTVEAKRITWIGIGVNGVMGTGKLAAGVMFNSAALIADAVHSIGDLASDFVTLGTLRIARRPKDETHPFGYGRYESLGALAVGGGLVVSAAATGFHSIELIVPLLSDFVSAQTTSASSTLTPPPVGQTALAAAAVAGLSIVSKEWLFRVTKRLGIEQRSQVLLANAWHHRTDALSSVVALVALVGGAAGLPILDPLGGVIVSGMILKAGADISLQSVRELVDHGAVDEHESHSMLEYLTEIVKEDGDLVDVLGFRARRTGPLTYVDIELLVPSKLSVSAAHLAGERGRLALMEKFPNCAEVILHVHAEEDADVEPFHSHSHDNHKSKLVRSSSMMRSHDAIAKEVVEVLTRDFDEILQVAHIRSHHLQGSTSLEVEIVVDDELKVIEARDIAGRAQSALLRLENVTAVDVHLELGVSHCRWAREDCCEGLPIMDLPEKNVRSA
eukprot:g223.t1